MSARGPAANNRRRVGLVITGLGVGGAEKALVRLARGLPRHGFEPTVCSIAPLPSRGTLVAELEQAGIAIHALDARSARQFVPARRRLKEWLRSQQPDVVQSFLFHANVLSASVVPASVPLVMGVRVAEARPLRLALERRLARRAAHVVAVSTAVERFLRQHGYPANKLLTIVNGVEPERFEVAPIDTSEFGIAAERRVLLAIGRLHPQKGFDWLIPTIRPLLERWRTHDLVVLGEGPQRNALERLADGSPFIRLVGWQPHVAEWLARSELLLLTSRYEGMPNVVLEAMAAGRPVLASCVEGVTELLGAHADPQTFGVGEAGEFTERLTRLVNDAALRTSLGEFNQRRAREQFSVEAMVERYARLYASLLGAG